MDEEAARREQNRQESVRREMYRRSRDTIRVYNSLPTVFRFMYDGYWHTVPANSKKDFERYLAEHFYKKISEYMIGQQQLVTGEELLAKRKEHGLGKYLDKYEENKEVWDKVPSLNDPELLDQIYNTVWVGLVEEYGLELPDEIPSTAPADNRPIHDQILSRKDKRVYEGLESEPEAPTETVEPVVEPEENNESLVKPLKDGNKK